MPSEVLSISTPDHHSGLMIRGLSSALLTTFLSVRTLAAVQPPGPATTTTNTTTATTNTTTTTTTITTNTTTTTTTPFHLIWRDRFGTHIKIYFPTNATVTLYATENQIIRQSEFNQSLFFHLANTPWLLRISRTSVVLPSY